MKMLVKSARRYINTLDKILKNQHNYIITEITEDDDMYIFSVTLKFHIEGLYCLVAAYNNDDNVLYYVEGNGRAVTYIISDNETQKESMYTILNRIYDIVVRLATETEEIKEATETEEIKEATETEEIEETTEYHNEYEEILDKKESTERDRTGNCCCGEKWCAETWKRYEAIINPEWHHVSLATLANIDFDMLDEKRQRYLTVYRELQETLARLRKCKTVESYDNCFIRFMRRINVMRTRGKISNEMRHFIESKLSMQNVESGVWASYYEKATGYHESRRYNRNRACR